MLSLVRLRWTDCVTVSTVYFKLLNKTFQNACKIQRQYNNKQKKTRINNEFMQLQTNPTDPCLLPFQARLFSEEVVCFRFLIAAIPHYLLLLCVLHVCILSLTFQSRKIFRRISYYPYKEKKIREIKHRIYGKRQT